MKHILFLFKKYTVLAILLSADTVAKSALLIYYFPEYFQSRFIILKIHKPLKVGNILLNS